MRSQTTSELWRKSAIVVVVAAAALALARIAPIQGPFSDNDRSRWATVRALVEQRSFSVGSRRLVPGGYVDSGIITEPGWTSVDVVMDPRTSLFYSSKPPFLSYLASYEASTLDAAGVQLVSDRADVMRAVLVVFCWLPFATALVALLAFVRSRDDDKVLDGDVADAGSEGALLAVSALGFGSFAAPFVVTFNNHVPACGACALALYCATRSLRTGVSPVSSAVAGLACGTAAALEPPALAFLVAWLVVLLVQKPARTAVFFLLPALLPLFVYGVTTAAAFGDPFHIAGANDDWFQFDGSYWSNPSGIDREDRSVFSYAFHFIVGHHGFFSLTPVAAVGVYGLACTVARSARSSASARAIRVVSVVSVVSIVAYGAAILLGRWLRQDPMLAWPWPLTLLPAMLPLVVVIGAPKRWATASAGELAARVSLFTIAVTLAFYVVTTRNFGGVAIGPRWLIWLTPLWCAGIPEAVRGSHKNVRVAVVIIALALSTYFALPRGMNPWEHPRLAPAAQIN